MLSNHSILVVEDNAYLALDLSMAIEQLDGRVIGPTRQIDEALALLASQPVAAAIVDCHPDRDVGPLARALAGRRVPFVFHAENALPRALCIAFPEVPFLLKPLQPRTVLAKLMVEIRRIAAGGRPNPLEAAPS